MIPQDASTAPSGPVPVERPVSCDAGSFGLDPCCPPRQGGGGVPEQYAARSRLFDRVLSCITDFAYIFDLDGRFTFANKPLLDLWSLSLDQAVGKNFLDLEYPRDLAAKLQQQIQDVIQTKHQIVDETYYTSPTGTAGYYQYIFSPVLGADGAVEAVAGSTRDITERKRSEEALRVSEERASIILESISDAFFALGRDWRFIYVNAQAERLLGRARGDLIGKSIWKEYPGLERSVFESAYRRAATEGVSGSVTSFYPDHDRWYEVHVYPASDGISIYFHDVSEQQRADERERRAAAEAIAVAEANAKFRTFFEQGTQFAGVLTLDGTVVEANRLCLDACGFTRDQIIGKKFWECGWWNRSPALMEMIQIASQQAASGRLFRQETNYFLADGRERFVDLTLSPVKDEAGRVLFIAPTGTDITDKKQLADDLQRLLKVERAARAEAETANRAKDKFLAVLSHELRTPLSPIVMTIPAIEIDPDLPLKFRDDLAMIRRNMDLEVKLIDDLLDLSRVVTGKLRLQKQAVRVHDVLRHAIHNSLGDSPAKPVHIGEELNAADDRLLADAARLQQVFWNLLRNAVKFTPAGGNITVRTANLDSGKYLRVEISDTGMGIAPEILPHIFDAFEQGDTRMSHQFGGLGLGLAIAKAVVEMHGGTITAASPGPGQGATFSVQLACAVENANAEPNPRGGNAAETQESRSSRVLLVEDHQDTARAMMRLLKLSGFDVKIAHTVAAALQLAEAERFDVVVSDIGLPDATGYDLMRQIGARHGIKGIALSGYGMEADLRQSGAAGFTEHIVKPVNMDQLKAVLRRVLDNA